MRFFGGKWQKKICDEDNGNRISRFVWAGSSENAEKIIDRASALAG
jgi:hypothetical protein